MKNSKLKGKIAYCDNKNLPGLKHLKGGHYVYIREVDKNGKCSVNIVTSLENDNKDLQLNKIKQVRKGNTYPIPKIDGTFTKWSGINKNPIKNVNVENLIDVGKKQIKRRHHFFIGKFLK